MSNTLLQHMQCFLNADRAFEPRNDTEEAVRSFFCAKLARALKRFEKSQPKLFAASLEHITDPNHLRERVQHWFEVDLDFVA